MLNRLVGGGIFPGRYAKGTTPIGRSDGQLGQELRDHRRQLFIAICFPAFVLR